MKLKIREIAVFSMLGALMFASKILMEAIPNVHLLGCMIMAITLVYRAKALFPIYIYVFVNGIYAGFAPWWIPYLYVWAILWGMTMLLPKKMPKKLTPVIYMMVCALHGFLFGVIYAPAQAWMFGYDFEMMLAWIVAGFPADIIHGISNFCMGVLIIPIASAIRVADKRIQ